MSQATARVTLKRLVWPPYDLLRVYKVVIDGAFAGTIRRLDQFGPKPVGLHVPAYYVSLDLWMTAGNFVSLYEDEEVTWAYAVLSFVIADADSALQRAERHARKRWSEQ